MFVNYNFTSEVLVIYVSVTVSNSSEMHHRCNNVEPPNTTTTLAYKTLSHNTALPLQIRK